MTVGAGGAGSTLSLSLFADTSATGVPMKTAAATTPPTVASAVLRRRIRSPRRRTSEAGREFTCSPSEKLSSDSSGSLSGMGGSLVSGSVGEEEGEGGAAAGEAGLDRALGGAGLPGDLVDGQVGDVVEHQRLPLGLRQLLERRDERDVRLVRRRRLRGQAQGPVGRAPAPARCAASG